MGMLRVLAVCALICAALGQDPEVQPLDDNLTSLNNHLKDDVAQAKTVQEVENAVEKGVSTALAQKQESEEKAKAKRDDADRDAAEKTTMNKAETAAMEAQTKTEETKMALEKSRQATLREQEKRLKVEDKLSDTTAQIATAAAKAEASEEKAEASEKKAAASEAKNNKAIEAIEEKVEEVTAKKEMVEPKKKEEKNEEKNEEEKEEEVAPVRTREEKEEEKEVARENAPKSIHAIHIAEAAAFAEAAKLKAKEGEALAQAAASKKKEAALALAKSTVTTEQQALTDLQQATQETAQAASDAKQDLSKALKTPFNGKALSNAVHEKKELQQEKQGIADLKARYESAKLAAAAAKQAVKDGELTGWGTKSPEAPTSNAEAKPMVVKPVAVTAKEAKKEEDKELKKEMKKETAEKNGDGMSEKEVVYWLSKKLDAADVDPRTPEQVMKEMFGEKQKEAQEVQALHMLQKSAETDTAPDANTDLIINGEVARAPSIITPSPRSKSATDEADAGSTTKMSDTHMQLKMDEIAKAKEADTEAAAAAARADTPALSKKTAPAMSESGQIAAAQEARANIKPADEAESDAVTDTPPAERSESGQIAAAQEAAKPPTSTGDVGESAEVSSEDIANEVSADSVLEHDDMGATDGEEGIDEANADAETDDMSVEDDDEGESADSSDDESADEEE